MKRTVADLFAGAGGMLLGFENAGYKVVFALDKDRNCTDTLIRNRSGQHKAWKIYRQKIEDFNSAIYKNRVDMLLGGFPCQPFSVAGNKLGLSDIRGTLIYDFMLQVNIIQPKQILLENVPHLLSHDNGNTFEGILHLLHEAGYTTTHKMLLASQHGVPQRRKRLFILATRGILTQNLDVPWTFPEPTLRDALHEVPISHGMQYSLHRQSVLMHVPEGGNWRDLPENIAREYMGQAYHSTGGRTGYARRLHLNKSTPTVLTSPIGKRTEMCHPEYTRPLTTREWARLQTFPDDWEFSGSLSAIYRQIGNAVPVKLAEQIARHILGNES